MSGAKVTAEIIKLVLKFVLVPILVWGGCACTARSISR